jgi:hypothetical protein
MGAGMTLRLETVPTASLMEDIETTVDTDEQEAELERRRERWRKVLPELEDDQLDRLVSDLHKRPGPPANSEILSTLEETMDWPVTQAEIERFALREQGRRRDAQVANRGQPTDVSSRSVQQHSTARAESRSPTVSRKRKVAGLAALLAIPLLAGASGARSSATSEPASHEDVELPALDPDEMEIEGISPDEVNIPESDMGSMADATDSGGESRG